MTNRLAQCQSLYLRKHAENPIDWWSWCDEALETAKAENKPIFLSIGYSSCHWCTVMEGEAFSDQAIADCMNANFLPIKVDREERPDLDSIYMQALQMMTGQGGWPLNIFLTPEDRVPFYGGTYFPVDPRYGRPGFLQVLQAIRRFYDSEKTKLQTFKEEILGHLQKSVLLPASGQLSANLLLLGLEKNTSVISGGSYGPSFPMIPYVELVLRGIRLKGNSEQDARQAAVERGLDLAKGGIYDHVGGGFHRYTVDATWTVPHFEKMLYDNGQIVEYLANLWSTGIQEAAFQRAIAGTVKWLKREMTSPQGFFYAAQDADSFTQPQAAEPEEGAFYVWSYRQLQQLLTSSEFAEIQEEFTLTPEGNFEGQNVLQRHHSERLSDTLETALAKLFAVRYGSPPDGIKTFPPARNNQEAKTGKWLGRIPPVTDTKMIVAWNSLMISGLARAYSVFHQPDYMKLAVAAANFILNHQWVEGRFHRLNYDNQPSVLAQSEDYALFIKALLDLSQASMGMGFSRERQPNGNGDKAAQFPSPNPWLENALKLQEEFDEFLWSVELGGYYNASSDSSRDLLVRERSYIDNATPSANGVAIANLVRLGLLTENLAYLDRAEQALQAFSSIMNQSPQGCPSLFTALDWFRNSTLIRTSSDQITSLIDQYLPTSMHRLETNLPEDAVGLVCQGLSCKPTAHTREQLLAQVQQSQTRG
ncbi:MULTISPECIES: thioredoxin domain-containing protein [unclassified Coleofasciculus]|uniref:thioredoxin domain-containing protein n=1 Tax=unclassified Coleofasciculus TaxID=2692782 RepID=UPI00187E5A3F|nr:MULTISPECIES: thioredoxin domain-containing protein [unclassified Coleofasciculus]MBE9125422.1 thioredoxin domain-containing protein [Coleofasciculus sp. LEGE 07081]MBE9147108.1 thioredoxin domain-containing protein [Coleofasciculus sp. LEGE 07092]